MARTKADFRVLRGLCGLSQQDVADMCGVKVLTVKRWERPDTDGCQPPEDAWDALDRERRAVEGTASAIVDGWVAMHDPGDGTTCVLGYLRGRGEGGTEPGGVPYGAVNAATVMAGERLRSMGYDVSYEWGMRS